MDINKKICNFQNCFVDKVFSLVKKMNTGEDSFEQQISAIAMHQQIKMLMNYDLNPKKKTVQRSVIVKECDVLDFANKSVILYKTVCEDIDPAIANCLSPEQICGTIENLDIMCSNCNCNC